MLLETDQSIIQELGHRYGVTRILLFGSSASSKREASDIDLAVEGIAPASFFRFYGDLLLRLSKPVDVIDLSADTKFNALVRAEGIQIYG